MADTLFPLDVASRFLHVAVAIVLVGGTVFMRFLLMPAVKELPDAEHHQLRERLLVRWRHVVHGGIAFLLITGLYNYGRQIPKHPGDALYHALLGTKMLLALVVFFVASALVGRSPTFEKLRQNRSQWLGWVVLLSAVIVGISGFVKVRGPQSKTAKRPPTETVQKNLAERGSEEQFSPKRRPTHVGMSVSRGRRVEHHEPLQESSNETIGGPAGALCTVFGASGANAAGGSVDR